MEPFEPKVLDINCQQTTVYAVPLWLRDEQIRVNSRRVTGRIAASFDLRPGPVAVACYGPSLADTWEALKGYEHVITCSGAHRFLVDRGVVPTWHVDVDPRPHKVTLLGEPHPAVTYLPASTVHPGYCDYLLAKGAKVELWHVFENGEEGLRVLPHGEWALTGGSDAGHRCLVIARFFGFRDIHVYGMDGSEGATGKHAAAHPNQPPKYALTTYKGREYRTTPAMLECVRQLTHEVDQLDDATVTFHGDGLAQAYMADYVRTPPVRVPGTVAIGVGVRKPELISAEYARLNRELHESNLAYGVGGGKHAPVVRDLVEKLKLKSVLDYGSGKSLLAKALDFPIWQYDPAVPEFAASPRPAELVCCTDVLEHVEPERLYLVLADLARCTLKVGFFVVHTGPSAKTLPDGRNTHLIQKPAAWWRSKLKKFFDVKGAGVKQVGPLAYFTVGPQGAKKKVLAVNHHTKGAAP